MMTDGIKRTARSSPAPTSSGKKILRAPKQPASQNPLRDISEIVLPLAGARLDCARGCFWRPSLVFWFSYSRRCASHGEKQSRATGRHRRNRWRRCIRTHPPSHMIRRFHPDYDPAGPTAGSARRATTFAGLRTSRGGPQRERILSSRPLAFPRRALRITRSRCHRKQGAPAGRARCGPMPCRKIIFRQAKDKGRTVVAKAPHPELLER